jgi:hypothetical protein
VRLIALETGTIREALSVRAEFEKMLQEASQDD